jgi:glyoxylase-like metal-dependent hydrolase (beta-lactamase superfamily II)
MALEVKILDLGSVELESSFLVHRRTPGKRFTVPVHAYLILGGEHPVLVDTGFRSPDIMKRTGMVGHQSTEQTVEAQLARFDVALGDIRYIVHTHLHIDHCGKDDLFPMNTTVVVNRREMEFSVAGLGGYQPEDIKHLIDRLHTKDALRFLDLELTGGEEVVPGLVCYPANAHTDGSALVVVETALGRAFITGDVIYDIHDQIILPFGSAQDREPTHTGHHTGPRRHEKAAIKRILNQADFILPAHDRAAAVKHAEIVGRWHGDIPGGHLDKIEPRPWFPVCGTCSVRSPALS